jgi:putative colanic acid biosynthesis acetyltransferase WcaB
MDDKQGKKLPNTKGRIFLCFFRTSAYFTRNRFLRIIGFPFRLFYKLFVQWFMGIDIPDRTKIGRNFNLFHGVGIVVSEEAVLGANITMRQCTTIGNSTADSGCPVIEDNVDIGANVVIIGSVRVGKNSIIGAGSVVIKDLPPYSVAVGNPARVIRTNEATIE